MNQIIDVHHHIIPPDFVRAMSARGIREVAGAPLPTWTPQASLDVMDMNGIATAITSLSAPGVYFGSLPEACDLARRCNEFAADMSVRYPGRFGSFAVLPMPFTEPACKEAVHALDVLQADGVVLLGSTEGVFLGDASLEELMAELNRRKAVVFVHPNLHASSQSLGLQTPGFLLEFLCDTTRAATNLIFSGTLEKYPDIRWVLAHAGGFLPYVAWRLSLGNLMLELSRNVPQGVLEGIRRFYFDTALSPSPFAMAALRELVEPSHILFGSDFPFAPAVATTMQLQSLEKLPWWSADYRQDVGRANALRLFSRHAAANETVLPADSWRSSSLALRLRRQLMRPVGALANRLRDQ